MQQKTPSPLMNSCARKTLAENIVEHAAIVTDCGQGESPIRPHRRLRPDVPGRGRVNHGLYYAHMLGPTVRGRHFTT